MNAEHLKKEIDVLKKGLEVVTLNIVAQTELVRQLNDRVAELAQKVDRHIESYNAHIM